MTLDNGQVWRQIQPSDYPLKRGDHVEIDVAALGSYRLWTPSTDVYKRQMPHIVMRKTLWLYSFQQGMQSVFSPRGGTRLLCKTI